MPSEPEGDRSWSNARRIEALERQALRIEARSTHLARTADRLSWLRLGLFCAACASAAAGFVVGARDAALLAAAGLFVAFAAAVARHRRIEAAVQRHAAWLLLLREQLARAAVDWSRLPPAHDHGVPPDHPYAHDLELVGERSLSRLLDGSTTIGGSRLLLDWLTAVVPDVDAARLRQACARELVCRPRLRRRLALASRLAGGTTGKWSADGLTSWLERHADVDRQRRWLAPVCVLGALHLAALAAAALGGPDRLWWLTAPAYLLAYALAMRGAPEVFAQALDLRDAIRPLASALGYLESCRYVRTPRLREVAMPIIDVRTRPTAHVRRLSRILAAAGVRANPMVWLLLNLALPWDLVVCVLLARLKDDLAQRVPLWLAAWYRIEALASLADAAYLNPEYVFPELAASAEPGGRLLCARGLGHPLLPASAKVGNDLDVNDTGRVMVITGANMSGKSTFVKAVGANAALAMAGGPASAREMVISPVRLFAVIRIADSLTDGISYFYAEVRRLRALLDAADEAERPGEATLLFLIDELFRGTNNRERLLGSREILRQLAGRPVAGLVATHDLELAALADEIGAVRNLHFCDNVEGDRMTFDFRVRAGPCPSTNALRIMRRAGLPTPDEPGTTTNA